MGICAYCGNDRPLTKEHLYPRWLYDVTPDHDIQILAKHSKVVSAQLQIKDVCGECNGGVLSALDSYAKSLYVESFSKFVRQGETRQLAYDYDLLARWLLKMCYNVARASATSDVEILQSTVPYILRGGTKPPGLQIIVRLIIPTQLTPEQFAKADQASLWEGMIPPNYDRVSRVDSPTMEGDLLSLWRVQLHAFQFYVSLPEHRPRIGEAKISTKTFLYTIEESIVLDPLAAKIAIPASSVDTLHDIAENLRAFAVVYKAHGLPRTDTD
jgi:hypothetical protein